MEANLETRDQDLTKRAAKGITMMHVGKIEDGHTTGNEEFKVGSSAELDNADNNVQLSFNMMDHW